MTTHNQHIDDLIHANREHPFLMDQPIDRSRCHRCHIPLTNEYGWRASDAASWSTYAAPNIPTCRGCARTLDAEFSARVEADRTNWPTPRWLTFRFNLLDRGWRQGPDTEGPGRYDFYADNGRWAVQWKAGKYVLCEAPDYEELVERSTGETWEQMIEDFRDFEVKS